MIDKLLNNQDLNQRFADAREDDERVDPQEAADYVSRFLREAPPELQQQVLHQYVSRLDPQRRQALARAMVQHDGTPVQDVRADDDDDLTRAFQRSGQALAARQDDPVSGLGGLFGMFGEMLGGQPERSRQPQTGRDQTGRDQTGRDQPGGLGDLAAQLMQNPAARAGLMSLATTIGSQLLDRRRR